MNEMQVFKNDQFGTVRTMTINGIPYFVGKDVAIVLGYTNPSKALVDHVDDEDKLNNESLSSLGQRGGWLINESGLYSLILSSRIPGARQFKRWVTSEVLPSINKHGLYATPQTLEQMIMSPDFGIRLLTEIKNEREKNAALVAENTELQAKIETDQPKIEFADALSTSQGSITVKQFAALLCQKGYSTGEKRMFEELRADGFILSSGAYRNEPAQRYLEMGTFEVRTYNYNTTSGSFIGRQVLITAKGIEYLIKYYMRKHGMLPNLTVNRRCVIERRTV